MGAKRKMEGMSKRKERTSSLTTKINKYMRALSFSIKCRFSRGGGRSVSPSSLLWEGGFWPLVAGWVDKRSLPSTRGEG